MKAKFILQKNTFFKNIISCSDVLNDINIDKYLRQTLP